MTKIKIVANELDTCPYCGNKETLLVEFEDCLPEYIEETHKCKACGKLFFQNFYRAKGWVGNDAYVEGERESADWLLAKQVIEAGGMKIK